MIRVAIIGAGRNRNGIGEYTAKYFQKHNAHVASVLGTTEETSGRAAGALRAYGIASIPYTNFDTMVQEQRPDAVVIASPSRTHLEYLRKCVEVGVHVLCEKPFIWPLGGDSLETVEGLLERFEKTGLTLAMNSQMPFFLNDYAMLCGHVDLKRRNAFYILLSPFCEAKEMVPESVPHVLSLLYVLFGRGGITNLEVEWKDTRKMVLKFHYRGTAKECEATVQLTYYEQQPRPFQFGVNGRTIERYVDPTTYDIYLQYGERRMKIGDPLELSVIDFLDAIEKKREPLIGPLHIAATTSLLKEIYENYEALSRRG